VEIRCLCTQPGESDIFVANKEENPAINYLSNQNSAVEDTTKQRILSCAVPFEFDGDRIDHYDRHRFDFGYADELEYERAADAMMAEPLSADLHEGVRPEGDRVRYRISTNEFVVLRADGFLRTYYCPDPDVHGEATNWDYFVAECQRVFL
jgi:pyocin large subunit-like protein